MNILYFFMKKNIKDRSSSMSKYSRMCLIHVYHHHPQQQKNNVANFTLLIMHAACMYVQLNSIQTYHSLSHSLTHSLSCLGMWNETLLHFLKFRYCFFRCCFSFFFCIVWGLFLLLFLLLLERQQYNFG